MANLIDVAKEFGTEEACHLYLAKLRWPNGVACLKCGGDRVSKLFSAKGRRGTVRYLFQCLDPACKHQFSATTGTLFHDSHLPLAKWFAAVAIITNAKKSVSAKQMERDLGVSYRTAWYLNHRIRKAMEETGGAGLMSGIVEVDETFVGGRYDKRRQRARYRKQPVMGFIQRGKGGAPSQVRAFPIPIIDQLTLDRNVRANVSPDANMVCTDMNPGYAKLNRGGFRHQAVNHITLEWVRPSQLGLVHTNSIENFWSLFKRGLVGSFHKVSVKHLHRYLGEFSYRFNGRRHDLFTPTLANLVGAIKMPYRQLVANELAS